MINVNLMHLLKVVFDVKSACEIMYTPSSPVSAAMTLLNLGSIAN